MNSLLTETSSSTPFRKKAFSILELFVVISIIAILATLVLKAGIRARNSLRDIHCLSNLKQWGLATQLYAQDNSFYLPQEGAPNGRSKKLGWYIDLPRMLRIPAYHEMNWRTNASIKPNHSIWICPSNPARSNGNNLFHYCLNGWVDGKGGGDLPTQLQSIRKPGRIVWMFDNRGYAAVAQWNNIHTNLHSKGANVLFLDGRAEQWLSSKFWNYARKRAITNHSDFIWVPR